MTILRRSSFSPLLQLLRASKVALVVKNLPVNAGDTRDAGSIPGLGRSPGVGNGNLLQYSCLEHPMDRGAWRATVHRVTKESDMTLVTRQQQKANKMIHFWDFPGGPMVRTPCFHCRVPSLVEDLRSHMLHNMAKKKKKLPISPCKWNLLFHRVLFLFLHCLASCFYFSLFSTSAEDAFPSRTIHQPKIFPSFFETVSPNNSSQIIQASWKVKSRNTTANETKLVAVEYKYNTMV